MELRDCRLSTERIGWNLPASRLFCRLTLREIALLRLFKIEHPRGFVGDEPPSDENDECGPWAGLG